MKRGPIKLLPSQEELQRTFDYDPETGVLRWKRREDASWQFNCKYAGKVAGTVHEEYIVIGWRRGGRLTYFQANRLIWKLMTGEDPLVFIDHRDGNKLNDRWDNLRPATNGQNIQNSKLRKDNSTGVKGVTWCPHHKSYRAVITANGIHYRLGRFKKLSEAEYEITRKRVELHQQFARTA